MKLNDDVCDFLKLFEFFAEFRKICRILKVKCSMIIVLDKKYKK